MSSRAGGEATGPDPRVVFVVHGRNMAARPSDGRAAAIGDGLVRATQRDPLPVAFGTKAFYGRVSSVRHVVEAGGEVWNVELGPDEAEQEWGHNMTGHPPEQVAETRARRALLDEKLPDSGGRHRRPNDFNTKMLEQSVAGDWGSSGWH